MTFKYLILGDQCDDSSDEVQALLNKSSHACTGHEEDSGFRPVHVSCWVWLGPVWMGKDQLNTSSTTEL